MDKDKVLAFAREAGGLPDPMVFIGAYERFASLVADAERNRIWTQEHWTEYERSIAAAEREACAKVCMAVSSDITLLGTAAECVNAIRARGRA